MSDTEHFFSKKYLIGAGWAVIFAVVGYCARAIVETKKEPEHVVVTNMPTVSPEVRATAELDKKTQAQLQSVVVSIQQAIREIQSSKQHASAAANEAAQARIDQLEDRLTKLQAAAASSQASAAQASAAQSRLSALAEVLSKAQADLTTKPSTVRTYATIVRPSAAATFELPAASKGYMLGQDAKLLRSFKCPQPSRIKGTAGILATFSVASATPMSPLWLILMEKASDGWVLRYSAYLPIYSGPNVVELSTDLDKGSYILRAGYFLRNELAGDYPPFFSRDCRLDVE